MGEQFHTRASKQSINLQEEICLFVCSTILLACFPCWWAIVVRTENNISTQAQPTFELGHRALMACSLFTTSLDLKEDVCFIPSAFSLCSTIFFPFFPFRLASPCPPPPLSHWISLTKKVWNRLRVGPQNKEAWQRFKSVWSWSRMGLCLHWASRRGKPAGNNLQLKALCCFSSQSSN